jgi:multidrug resistance efflux pump
MNHRQMTLCALLTVLFLITGCAATQELTSSVKTKVSSITSTVDPALVSQVPADKRDGFAKAEYDLKVAAEKVKLAELKAEHAAAQNKYYGYEEDMAVTFRKEAQIDYDLVKMEAIIKSGLGKKEENIKTKADLQSKKLKVQAERINIQADLDNTKARVEDLVTQIAKMDEAIKAMKFNK